MTLPLLSRRRVLALTSAALAAPNVLSAAPGWDALAETGARFDQMNCIVVARDGEVVFARSLRGPEPERPVNVKSVSKTIVASLTGAAIDRGDIAGVDATLTEVAPGLIPSGADPKVRDLTMADLLTMQAGLERTSGANYGGWVSSSNWVANALARPMVAEPGSRMLYSTGSYHILGAALTEAAGESLLSQARGRLGGPLGIEIPAWTRDPQGYYLGGNEMAISPLGLARFGEMTRQGGTWQGNRVLSDDWVRASMIRRTRSPYSGLSYGYGWFLGRMGRRDVALARGYGGQVVCVIPALEATVVITSDPTRPARSGGYFGDLMGFIEGPVIEGLEAA